MAETSSPKPTAMSGMGVNLCWINWMILCSPIFSVVRLAVLVMVVAVYVGAGADLRIRVCCGWMVCFCWWLTVINKR